MYNNILRMRCWGVIQSEFNGTCHIISEKKYEERTINKSICFL